MSLPADVLAFTLKLEVPADHTGEKRPTRYTIIPSTELIHPATKLRLLPAKIQEQLAADAEPKSVTLPHPAGTGIIDATGAEVTDWRYEVTEHHKINGVWAPVSGTRIVQPVAGQTVVDLALIPVEETPRGEHRITPADRAIAARDDAERFAGYAAGSALTASAAADDAGTSAGAAAGAAFSAASARAAAGDAEQGAVTARTAAESARDAAATARTGAETARDTATTKASAASTSAGEAATSAAGAVAAVADARTARDQASGHASAAGTSASDAAGSATAAGQSAFGAAADRARAETAKTDAESARTSAESAKTAAEAARDLALAGQFFGTLVAAGTDANTLINPGTYRFSASASQSGTNHPFGTTAGVIEVFQILSTTGNAVIQRATPYSSAASSRVFWERQSNGSAGFSTPWRAYTSQRIATVAGQVGAELYVWDDVNGKEISVPSGGTAFSSGSLDALTAVGEFFNTTTTTATLANNWPIAGVLAVVEVLQASSTVPSAGGNIVQRVTPYGGAQLARGIYTRTRTSGTWNPWRFIPSQRVDQTAGRAIYTWDDLNNREQLIYGDTGWRNITANLLNGWAGGTIYLRRVGSVVTMRLTGTSGANKTAVDFIGMDLGFRPLATTRVPFCATSTTVSVLEYSPTTNAWRSANTDNLGSNFSEINWTTTDPWPTSLPGTAVGSIPA